MRTSEDLFESRGEVLSKLLMALKDDDNKRIGLYGMGGCGKTYMLNVVQERVKDLKLFDKVAYANVSNPPKISAIQQDIADWIGLNLEKESSVIIRARRLSMGFLKDKKYLIILDDVWEVLDFDVIGIPSSENCKVLLSSRLENICNLMSCKEMIHLSLLTDGEAQSLFRKHANLREDTFDVIAKQVANECQRLPIAIKAVACTLKGKANFVWKDALATLKDHRLLNIEKGLENPFGCLELSIDHLEDEVKSLFLLCAVFPKGSKIDHEDLIKFAWGLSIFEDIGDSYARARSKVGAAIDTIKDCSLLLQLEEAQIVEMHDLVRDVALWMTNKRSQVIIGPNQELKTFTKMDYAKDTRRLYCHETNEFPDQLNCPNLEILYVSCDGGCSSKFPDTFYKEMIELKVLVIITTDIWANPSLLLPQSLEGLKKLRTLCLRGWTLDNISIFEKLETLGTIQLLCCVLKELPNEFAEQMKLKFLEVSGCRIGGNPFKVLAGCSHLEELYFVQNTLDMVSNDWDVVRLFHHIGHSKVLQRYHVEIGSYIDTLKDELTSKFISINNFNASTTNEAIQYLMKNLEVLFLEKIKGDCKSIIPEIIPVEGECMFELTEILLRDCVNIECLIDTTNHQLDHVRTLFSKLLKLKIEDMKFLKVLSRGSPASGLFENLKFMELEDCQMLTSLFTTAAAQKMVMLEVLKIIDCVELKHIVEDETEDDIISTEPVFPKLKQVSIKGCKRLESIIPAFFARGLLQLESLEIKDALVLKHVFGKCNHEVDQNQKQSIDFPVLKVFKLIDLPNIISMCPKNYHVTCPFLDERHVIGCAQWCGMPDIDFEVRQQGSGVATKQVELLSMSCGEDVGTNVQAGTVKNFVQAATRPARFNTLVANLGKEKDKLRSTREMILVNADNNLELSEDLLKQLEEACNLIIEAEELESRAESTKAYCHVVCLNWFDRYNIAKDLITMTGVVKQLNERLASYPLGSRDVCSENFISFESRKMAHDELLMALKDDGIIKIGLCGIGGCGKTSLALEICKVAEQLKLFDKVVFVSVSRYPKISVIQDEISCSLGLRFYINERVTERAEILSMRLNNGDKFLIVLDDIWQELNLEDIGIPRDKNCKLLMTAQEQLKCASLDCQTNIYLSPLTQEEAWILFKRNLGTAKSFGANITTQNITEVCGELPIEIMPVARFLKSKPAFDWESTLQQVMTHGEKDEDHKLLKYFIHNLEHFAREHFERMLFLLCALFPKGSNIALEMLVRFSFGLGIFKDGDLYLKARNKVSAAISELKGFCLLSPAKEGCCIHVHDLMHDLASSVAEKTQLITRLVEDPMDLTEMKAMEETTRLYCHNINQFPNKLHCPKLEILFMSTDGECSSKISDAFFDELIKLTVLAIKNTSLGRITDLLLPQSVVRLKMLRTLCLRGMKLDNIFLVGKLEMLDTIELAYCEINELPKELAELCKLKLLEVSRSIIKANPFEVLARCSQLEELYFIENDLPEMLSNDHDVIKLLHQIGSSRGLERCHLQIGSFIDTLKDDSKSKFISLSDFNVSTSNKAIKDLAQKFNVLFLKEIQGDYKNIIPDMIPTEGECMNELIEFLLCHCDNIECLIDSTNLDLCHDKTVFSSLLKLKLKTMRRLEALCCGHPPLGLFEKLEELFILECSQLRCVVSVGKLNLCSLRCLQLEDCPNLTFVFTYSTAQTMVLLEVLKVRGCTALKHIVKDEMEEDDSISAGLVFPRLKQVRVRRCDHLECIIPASFAGGLSLLESLEIEDASELKHVFGKYIHEDQNSNQRIDLPILKVFKLINLPNISNICSQNYNIILPSSLDGPLIRGCPLLSTSSRFDLDSEVRQQGDDKVEEQELVLPTMNTESNSVPEGSQQEYERPEGEEEAIATAEQEHSHDDDAEDKDEREEQQHNEEYAIPEDNKSVIDQSTTSYMEIGNPSVGNYSLPSTSASGMSKVDEIYQDKEVSSQIALTYTTEGRGFATVPSTIEDDNLDEENQKSNNDIPCGFFSTDSNFHLPKQDGTSDLHCAVQAAVEIHPDSQEFDEVVDTQQGLREQNLYPVGSVNPRESCIKIEKGSLHKDLAPEESKAGTSSQKLIDKQPQVELELPQVVVDPQQTLEEYEELHLEEAEAAEEYLHDGDGEDEDGREEKQQPKEEELAVQEDSSASIQLSSISCVETREVEAGNYPLPSTTAPGADKVDAIYQDKEVPSQTALASTVTSTIQDDNLNEGNQRSNNDIPSGISLIKAIGSNFHSMKQDVISASHQQMLEDSHIEVQGAAEVVDTQESLQEHHFYPVGSMNLTPSNKEMAKQILDKDHALEKSKVGTSSQKSNEKQPQVELEMPQVGADPQQAFQEYKVPLSLPVHPPMLSPSTSINITPPTLEAPTSSSTNQHPSHTALTCSKDGKGFVTVTSTIQSDNLDEENQRSNNDIPSGFTAAGSNIHLLKQDDISAAELHPQSQNFQVVDIQEGLQKQNFCPVSSINPRESCTKIGNGSLHKDPTPEESKVGTSSQESIDKQQWLEPELPRVVVGPQHALEKYKEVLLPSTCVITTSPTIEPTASSSASSSANQHPSAEESVDFHGLFKMKARRAHLLEEAFVKYPHLWEWRLSQKTPRICKVGYKFLADMLAFLESETPKAMDDSKRKEFEDLYAELEHSNFNKEWLASLRQRVNDMQVDHNDKLKQRDHLKSQISTLEKQLNDTRTSLATMEDDLSKPGNVFGF